MVKSYLGCFGCQCVSEPDWHSLSALALAHQPPNEKIDSKRLFAASGDTNFQNVGEKISVVAESRNSTREPRWQLF
jgi:hypothetical protein